MICNINVSIPLQITTPPCYNAICQSFHLITHLINGCSLTKHWSKWIEVANGARGFVQVHTQITQVITNLSLFKEYQCNSHLHVDKSYLLQTAADTEKINSIW